MMQITRKRIKKTHASYTLEGSVLENVESIKYFRVFITIFALRLLGFLRRNLYACPQEVKEVAYKVLVCPVLEYNGYVWDPSSG